MYLSLATPERIVFQGDVEDILLETEKGQTNILENHTNFISFVYPGDLEIQSIGEHKKFVVSEGVVKVEENRVHVLCQGAS